MKIITPKCNSESDEEEENSPCSSYFLSLQYLLYISSVQGHTDVGDAADVCGLLTLTFDILTMKEVINGCMLFQEFVNGKVFENLVFRSKASKSFLDKF